MKYQRMIASMTLAALVPIAAGCSTVRTYDVGTDPFASGAVQMLLAGESLEIVGYTTSTEGHRDFRGQVRLLTQDTLEFTPSGSSTKSNADASFTRPCREVASVDVVIPDAEKTRLATTVTAIAVGAAVTGIAIAAASNSGSLEPRF